MPQLTPNQKAAAQELKAMCAFFRCDAVSAAQWKKYAAVNSPGTTITAHSLVKAGIVREIRAKISSRPTPAILYALV